MRMRIGQCLITSNGITCLKDNILNDYILGYFGIRLFEILAIDIINKFNSTENLIIVNNVDFLE